MPNIHEEKVDPISYILMTAISQNDPVKVSHALTLQSVRTDIDKTDIYGYTPLMNACKAAKIFLNVERDESNPACKIQVEKSLYIIASLLKADADPTMKSKLPKAEENRHQDFNGKSAFDIAEGEPEIHFVIAKGHLSNSIKSILQHATKDSLMAEDQYNHVSGLNEMIPIYGRDEIIENAKNSLNTLFKNWRAGDYTSRAHCEEATKLCPPDKELMNSVIIPMENYINSNIDTCVSKIYKICKNVRNLSKDEINNQMIEVIKNVAPNEYCDESRTPEMTSNAGQKGKKPDADKALLIGMDSLTKIASIAAPKMADCVKKVIENLYESAKPRRSYTGMLLKLLPNGVQKALGHTKKVTYHTVG